MSIRKLYEHQWRRALPLCGALVLAVGLFCFWSSSSTAIESQPLRKKPVDTVDRDALRRKIHRMVFHEREILFRELEAALQRYVESRDRVHVDLVPEENMKLLAGQFKEISLRLENTVVRKLPIDRAVIRIKNPVLDFEALLARHKFRFKHPGEVDLLLVVGEDSLNDFMKKKGRKLKVRNPRIDFKPGYMRFSGGLRLLCFKNHVAVSGKLVVTDCDRLSFHPTRLSVGHLPVPGFIARALARRVNPLLTFDDLKFKVRVSSIELTEDKLYVSSEAMHEEALRLVAADRSRRIAAASKGSDQER